MLNQAAVEALYSATYIENYLDYVENVPDELQRYVSRVRELDLTYVGFLKEIEQHCDALVHDVDSASQKKSFLSKVQQALICAQELGDEKLQVMQQLQDIIENKTRQLDLDYRNLADIGKDGDSLDASRDSGIRESSGFSPSLNNGGSGGERQSKRVRRTRTDLGPQGDQSPARESVQVAEPVKQAQQTPQQSTPSTAVSSAQKKVASASLGKKKKRKSRQSNQQATPKDSQTSRDSQKDRDESPARDDEMLIDPDEPTYCLCDQISYGEMICCDNDLCPYEWFHFSCVSLGVKPKGKWYCPKCRGDRSSVMKPKAQLMKELERIKQEKETKEEKGS